MDYSLINKYLAGDASEAETREIFHWIEAARKNRADFIRYKKVWALTSKSNVDTPQAWSEVAVSLAKPRNRRIAVYRHWIVAAGFLLVFGLGALMQYIFDEKTHREFSYGAETLIEVPPGQMSDVVLSDGTKVQLNSGSKLYYSGKFSEGERTVRLEGEAFFDVTNDPEHPFFVKTTGLDFKVYGTSFNIQAYPEDNVINTTLVEGSLGLFGKSGSELVKLVPGETATYRGNDKKLHIDHTDPDLYTSWKEGLVTFRNEKLKDIARKIERWYNVEIVIKNDRLGEELFLGTILKNKPVDQILEVFALTSSLKYRMVPRADQPTLIYWE